METARHFDQPVVVVSNRGPLSFAVDETGGLRPVRASGGLVATLAPVLHDTESLWVSTAVSEGDRQAAMTGVTESSGYRLLHLDIDPQTYRRYYDVIANGTLWFLHHRLFDDDHQPQFDEGWWEAWHDYVAVNQALARAVADTAPQGATVLVQDYHLTLLGKYLHETRPDIRTAHFHHTPFAESSVISILPPSAREQLLSGLANHGACGFHAERWADNFRQSCIENLGAAPKTFVSAAVPDLEDLQPIAISPLTVAARDRLRRHRSAGRRLLVRVDRIELSKNIVRGFSAYDLLLRQYPDWREKVVFAAFTYPSRVSLPEYVAYRREVESIVAAINDRWGTEGWQPIELRTDDDFPTSVAAYCEYDVLLVNPLRDGLNLVAKEGAALNENNGVIVLSREAGAWTDLEEGAIGVDPFDVEATADALAAALSMPISERKWRADVLRQAATARTPHDWFADQLRAARGESTLP